MKTFNVGVESQEKFVEAVFKPIKVLVFQAEEPFCIISPESTIYGVSGDYIITDSEHNYLCMREVEFNRLYTVHTKRAEYERYFLNPENKEIALGLAQILSKRFKDELFTIPSMVKSFNTSFNTCYQQLSVLSIFGYVTTHKKGKKDAYQVSLKEEDVDHILLIHKLELESELKIIYDQIKIRNDKAKEVKSGGKTTRVPKKRGTKEVGSDTISKPRSKKVKVVNSDSIQDNKKTE